MARTIEEQQSALAELKAFLAKVKESVEKGAVDSYWPTLIQSECNFVEAIISGDHAEDCETAMEVLMDDPDWEGADEDLLMPTALWLDGAHNKHPVEYWIEQMPEVPYSRPTPAENAPSVQGGTPSGE